MTDAKAHSLRRTVCNGPSRQDPNHPLPQWPMAHVDRERANVSAADLGETTGPEGAERDDAIVQLAGELRAAARAHRAYIAELRLGDVEPVEDWSSWYAEYLLGLR